MLKQSVAIAATIFFTAAFAFAAPLAKKAEAAASGQAQINTLSVHGTGNVKAAPDFAAITLGITTQAKDTTAAQAQNAQIAAAIHAAMKKIGIADKEIQTQNYNCWPEYSERKIIGYRVNNSIRISVSDFSLIGKVIDEALKSGANEVSALEFSLKDSSKVRAEALTKAVQDAQEQAQTVAAALGKTIAGIATVNVSSSSYYPQHRNAGLMMAKSMADGAIESTPVAGGEINYDAAINVVFIIK